MIFREPEPDVPMNLRLPLLCLCLFVASCDRGEGQAEQGAAAPVEFKTGRGVTDISNTQRSFLEAQAALPKSDETRQVVARIGSWELTMEELDQRAGRAHLRKLRDIYETRFAVLDSMLAAKLYELEAEKQGITARELFERLVKSVDPAVNAGAIAELPVEERQEGVENSIRKKIFERHKEYVVELAMKYGMAMTMAEPASLVNAGDLDDAAGDGEIILGAQKSSRFDVEIYTDFTCPYCREVHPSVERLISTYGQRLRFIFRPMMTGERLGSRPAAVASYCVYRDKPDQFLAFARRLFETQEALAAGEDAVRRVAAELGIPDRKFRECLADESVRAVMTNGTQMAMERGIQNTPTLLIDGVPVIGNHDYPTYVQVIEQVFQAHALAEKQKGQGGG